MPTKELVIGLLIGLLLGAALISLAGNPFSSSSNFNVPSGHTNIAGQIAIVDTTMGMTSSYDPVFISSAKTPSLSILPLSFSATGQVSVSKWEYRSDVSDGSTVYAYLTIFGPDSSGHTYWVEVSRASPDVLHCQFPSGTHTFPYNGNDGYFYTEIQG